mmetsp:Transcript_21355/g.46648  ORF Transcript_21355/g.46648 Transcript_21355/m.46648 type:complete len:95 (+) Transcript_21355:3394-3678(+)
MDTICYRKDPLTDAPNIKMVNVLESYHRLNRQAMKEQSSWFRSKFDHYDQDNDESAIAFLLNSLEPDLEDRIAMRIDERYTFVDVLFIFLDHQR